MNESIDLQISMQGAPPLAPVPKASTLAMHFGFFQSTHLISSLFGGSQADPKISSEVGLQDDGFSFFWLCLFDISINFLAF